MTMMNAWLIFWASCQQKAKRDPDAGKPRGFVARHPGLSLIIIAAFAYIAVKIALLLQP